VTHNHAMQRTREPPSGCSFVSGRGPLIAGVMPLLRSQFPQQVSK
jgi:hypothetical protein